MRMNGVCSWADKNGDLQREKGNEDSIDLRGGVQFGCKVRKGERAAKVRKLVEAGTHAREGERVGDRVFRRGREGGANT